MVELNPSNISGGVLGEIDSQNPAIIINTIKRRWAAFMSSNDNSFIILTYVIAANDPLGVPWNIRGAIAVATIPW